MFREQDFVDACSELETPIVDGWEFFTESHDVKIYRLYNEVSIMVRCYVHHWEDYTVGIK